MDRRFYKRAIVNLEGSFITNRSSSIPVEFIGVIKDISEGGIKVEVSNASSKDLLSDIAEGNTLSFQTYDEYDIYKEHRIDIFNGEVEVIHVTRNDSNLIIGCRFLRQTDALLDYINNKKLSIFFQSGLIY